MKLHKLLILAPSKMIIAALLAMSCLVTAAPQNPPRERSLSMTILPGRSKYVEGETLPITLTFRNVSNKRTSFTIAENDKNPPGFIWARVWDSTGTLLTKNDTLKDGWWTVWVLSSSTYKEKDSDRIGLDPAKEYTRTVDLKGLLAGCPNLPLGLRAGTYQVQFALGAVLSNKIALNIKRKK